ncbi:protein kinase [Pseudomonas sp. J452]|uniref:protein kinase n=1 Tax=Pseudomonas sp. J452 TaxID=2898441 RepID=UPI0021ADD33C|nr:protein kinase [Pseudomonas sp. J452]UUY10029.1 protein kinase [Pseudomonas sp. J452]
MSLQWIEQPIAGLALGQGLDLPGQAARSRAAWIGARQGDAPLLLVALLWARQCADVVQILDEQLDALFADFLCTPQGWSDTQAARQVLSALNLRLFRQRQASASPAELSAGLLLVRAGEVHFLQAGNIGLLRYQQGVLQSLAGRAEQYLGVQAELALVQHHLPGEAGTALLLAPQPLFEVADLQAFRSACGDLPGSAVSAALTPLLQAPGAAVLLLPEALSAARSYEDWQPLPCVAQAQVGMRLDGWLLQAECPYGPVGRVFQACAEDGREALLWLAAGAADEAFWQREWVLRRCSLAALPQVVSPRQPRRSAYLLLEPPAADMCSLSQWRSARGNLEAATLLPLLGQLIDAVRALQRRGMQGLWLNPRQILLNEQGRLLLLPELAAILPGVPCQRLPAEALPLAPEVRAAQAVDGRAEQFAVAALAYWLLCGQWPEAARSVVNGSGRYVPLARLVEGVPLGWDGVLARALAPQAGQRYEALSELQFNLQQLFEQDAVARSSTGWLGRWRRLWRPR